MSDTLRDDDVRHVAKLARLELDESAIESFRQQLSSVLDYFSKLNELDLSDVEPMAHPLDITNRLDEDVEREGMPTEDFLKNAPAAEDRFLAVPKVLGD